MQNNLKIFRLIGNFGLWFGGALVLLSALIIGCDVLSRRFLNISIGGSDELAQFALAIGTTWSLAGALLARNHIRVDSAYERFPAAARIVLDFVGLGLFLAFYGVMAWHAGIMVGQTWESSTRSQSALQIPLVVPQVLWLAGLLAFLVVGAGLFVEALRLLVHRRGAEVSALIGTKSTIEETEEEAEAIGRLASGYEETTR